MTENEAIKILDTEKHCLDKSTKGLCKINCGDCKANIPIAYQEKSYEVAITALKEIQRYREIGTVEECREAREKQKPKNPVKDKYHHNCCPNCGWIVSGECGYGEEFCPHCENCGQAIQWENLKGMEDENT